MNRTVISVLIAAVLGLLVGYFAAPFGAPQETPGAAGATIVIPLNVVAGKNMDEAVQAMKNVAAFVQKQPGLISHTLMQSSFPANRPSHVVVMQWRDVKDWEALSSSQEFLDLLVANAASFEINAAEIFAPVK